MTARPRSDVAAALVAALAEQSPCHAGRSSIDVERSRAAALSDFEALGLPPEALPFVLEELETGRNPSTVAAAGRALRASSPVPAEAPELLVAAIGRLRANDDVVSFGTCARPATDDRPITALADLAATLAQLGPEARCATPPLRALIAGGGFSAAVTGELARALDALTAPEQGLSPCCHEDPVEPPPAPGVVPDALSVRKALGSVVLEDQDCARRTFADSFAGRPTILAFFYTRCTNPEKCSLTVTRLARLARLLDDDDVDANVAGISYDPGYDRPGRLRTYGADRGMAFSPRCSLLRTVGPFAPLRDTFDLGVGFGPVTVNRHRLDVVVLDAALAVTERFERRLWHEDTVLDALRQTAAAATAHPGVSARVR